MAHQHPAQARQLPLDPAMEQEAVLKKARALFDRSRYLSSRFASFDRLMADPVTGRAMWIAATQCVRSAVGRANNRQSKR